MYEVLLNYVFNIFIINLSVLFVTLSFVFFTPSKRHVYEVTSDDQPVPFPTDIFRHFRRQDKEVMCRLDTIPTTVISREDIFYDCCSVEQIVLQDEQVTEHPIIDAVDITYDHAYEVDTNEDYEYENKKLIRPVSEYLEGIIRALPDNDEACPIIQNALNEIRSIGIDSPTSNEEFDAYSIADTPQTQSEPTTYRTDPSHSPISKIYKRTMKYCKSKFPKYKEIPDKTSITRTYVSPFGSQNNSHVARLTSKRNRGDINTKYQDKQTLMKSEEERKPRTAINNLKKSVFRIFKR